MHINETELDRLVGFLSEFLINDYHLLPKIQKFVVKKELTEMVLLAFEILPENTTAIQDPEIFDPAIKKLVIKKIRRAMNDDSISDDEIVDNMPSHLKSEMRTTFYNVTNYALEWLQNNRNDLTETLENWDSLDINEEFKKMLDDQ